MTVLTFKEPITERLDRWIDYCCEVRGYIPEVLLIHPKDIPSLSKSQRETYAGIHIKVLGWDEVAMGRLKEYFHQHPEYDIPTNKAAFRNTNPIIEALKLLPPKERAEVISDIRHFYQNDEVSSSADTTDTAGGEKDVDNIK